MTNIAAVVDRPAAQAPGRPALILDDGQVCTYGELAAQTRAWAATLAAREVGPGHTVALVDWGGVRSTAVTLAAAGLGAATAQMNPLLTRGELAQLVEVTGGATVGVADPDAAPALAMALGPEGVVLTESDDAPSGGDDPPSGGDDPPSGGDDPPSGGADPPSGGASWAPGGDTAALILFTSGTTGLPKPVAITHAALLARMSAYRRPFDPERPPGVALMCVPSFHVGGMLGLLVSLYSGETTVVLPRFDAGRWLSLVATQRVNSAFVVPTMLARILDHPDVDVTDVRSLHAVAYGAAAAPVQLVRRAMAQWPGVAFANVFGQTETLGAYTTLSGDDHHDPARAGSVGRPLPGVEVRVVDPDTGAVLDVDQVGELWVRSPQNVGDGADEDGWLHTGDLARQDADGYLFPVGRRSDGINRGGEKFTPHEVAEVLRQHPSVGDLVVVGMPDPEMGERVGVAVVVAAGQPEPSLDQLRGWCDGRLASFKRPEVLAVVEALPSNELGKLPRAMAVDLIRQASPGSRA